MQYTQLKQKLDLLYTISCEEPVAPVGMLWGPPGGGKTQKIYQWVQERGLQLWTVLGSTLAPTDVVCYMPDTATRKLIACFTERFPDVVDNPDAEGIIFLDEAPNTHQEVMKPLMKLINERELDGLVIPKRVMFLLAGNRVSDRAGANQLLSSFSNRLDHMEFTVDPEEVADHFMEKGYDPMLVSYFYVCPDQVHIFEPQNPTWPNPRTWEFLALKMKYAKGPLTLADMAGVLGLAAAKQFHAYLLTAEELHSKADLIADPLGIDLPTKSSHEWQTIAMLSTSLSPKEFEPVSRYVQRLPDNRQVLFIKLLRKRKDVIEEIQKSTPYKKWVTQKHLYDLVVGQQ
jgi:hypothetical protein